MQPLRDPGGVEADPRAERLRVDGVEDLVADDGEAGADHLGALLLQRRDDLVQLERPAGVADEHHVQRPVLVPHLDHRHAHAAAAAAAGRRRRGRAAAAEARRWAGSRAATAPRLPLLQRLDPRLELLDVRRRAVQLVQLRHRVLREEKP